MTNAEKNARLKQALQELKSGKYLTIKSEKGGYIEAYATNKKLIHCRCFGNWHENLTLQGLLFTFENMAKNSNIEYKSYTPSEYWSRLESNKYLFIY